jgi:hypothetical protein
MEEFTYRSRALRWSLLACGLIFVLLSLFEAAMVWRFAEGSNRLLAPRSYDVATPSPEERQAVEDLAAQMERLRTSFAAMEFGLALTPCLNLAAGAYLIYISLAILPRARRRAAAWQSDRAGGPHGNTGQLFIGAALAIYSNLFPPLFLASQVLGKAPETDTSLSPYITYVCFQAAGIVFLVVLAVHLYRRRHFRGWRLHVAAVPVLLGEPTSFEIRREDGRPLDPGLRLELVGYWRPCTWNLGLSLPWRSLFGRPVPGHVLAEIPAGPPSAIAGVLQIDAAGLSLTPPPGIKRPCRLFAFVRVRQGRWTKCLFEVPLPEVYVLPAAAPAPSVLASASPH